VIMIMFEHAGVQSDTQLTQVGHSNSALTTREAGCSLLWVPIEIRRGGHSLQGLTDNDGAKLHQKFRTAGAL